MPEHRLAASACILVGCPKIHDVDGGVTGGSPSTQISTEVVWNGLLGSGLQKTKENRP